MKINHFALSVSCRAPAAGSEQGVGNSIPAASVLRLTALLRLLCVGVVMSLVSSTAAGQDKITQEQMQFFETKIRPILVDKCYSCHAEKEGDVQGGLLLELGWM